MTNLIVPVIKDSEAELPVPTTWRPTIQNIVSSFVRGDYCLDHLNLPEVAPIPMETALDIKEYIQDYGETLIDLPEASWDSSIYIWMGMRWDVLVDLWTLPEGRSDLVLHLRIFEDNDKFRFHVDLVYVP